MSSLMLARMRSGSAPLVFMPGRTSLFVGAVRPRSRRGRRIRDGEKEGVELTGTKMKRLLIHSMKYYYE
jgi:hypothetical protein